MLFRRRQKRGGPPGAHSGGPPAAGPSPQLYHIDFDMMLRGSTCKRGRGTVRQFGVTVHGSTRLVTSGDVVDAETYNALLAMEAIRPIRPEPSEEPVEGGGDSVNE